MSRSSTTGSACTRPWATAPRPRRGPAWKGSTCARPRDVLIPPLHSSGGGPSPPGLPRRPVGGSRRMRRALLERCADRDHDLLPPHRLLVGGGGRDRCPLFGEALDDHLGHLPDVGEHLLARGAPGGGAVGQQGRAVGMPHVIGGLDDDGEGVGARLSAHGASIVPFAAAREKCEALDGRAPGAFLPSREKASTFRSITEDTGTCATRWCRASSSACSPSPAVPRAAISPPPRSPKRR